MTDADGPGGADVLRFPRGRNARAGAADTDAFAFLSIFGAMNFVGIGDNLADSGMELVPAE